MIGIVKYIYKGSPVFLQNLVITLYGWVLIKKRYGKKYKHEFNRLICKDYSSLAVLEEEQLIRLREFLSYCYESSEYYKLIFDEFYFDPKDIESLDELKKLPVLEKEDLRRNIDKIRTISVDQGISAFTGGTTGKSLEVVYTKNDFQERMAYLDSFKSRLNLNIDLFKSRKATFSGREIIHNKDEENIFWRNNYAYRQRLYSTFHVKQSTMRLYVDDLNIYKPEIINGFVSAIYEISKYIVDNNIQLDFNVGAVFTTSETLLDYHRGIIEKAFKCRVYNQYASAEGAPFITECREGSLHYCIDTGVIERNEDTGEIYVTSFTTHGTPLVRYAIGDRVSFKEGVCSCGSAMPLVDKVEGRAVDYLEGIGGIKVSLSHLSDVIKGLPNCVEQVQFVQKSLSEILVKVVADESIFNFEHHQKIKKSMLIRFGNNMSISVVLVKEIPREKSGKHSLIKKIGFNKL